MKIINNYSCRINAAWCCFLSPVGHVFKYFLQTRKMNILDNYYTRKKQLLTFVYFSDRIGVAVRTTPRQYDALRGAKITPIGVDS